MSSQAKPDPARESGSTRYSAEELRNLALEDALNISDRFAREPVYAKTGKGYYKGAGVEGLEADRRYLHALDE